MTDQRDTSPAGEPDQTYSKAMLDVAFSDEARPHRLRHERVLPEGHVGEGHRFEEPFAIYDVADVRTALGEASVSPGFEFDGYEGDPEEREPPIFSESHDSDHQARLRTIIERGERGRWRTVVGPRPDALDAIQALGLRAPHMRELTDLVSLHVRASLNASLPVTLPSICLTGPAGTGKTWYLTRLAALLGVPFRSHPLSSSSLSDGIQGSSPSWKAAAPGLVAKLLLLEKVANPLVLCDEADKPGVNPYNVDPYRPFYSLLDPSNSKAFIDEYMQFPLDARHISWVLVANDESLFPAPITDRLTVLYVPEMSREDMAAVAASIYREANSARRAFFEPEAGTDVIGRLVGMNPRSMRVALDGAMVRAAAENRRRLLADDVRDRPGPARQRIGFR